MDDAQLAGLGLVREAGREWRRPVDWSDDPNRCALYFFALGQTGLFFSRDQIEQFLALVVTKSGRPPELGLGAALAIASDFDETERRIAVALTWPRPFGLAIDDVDELLARLPAQLHSQIQVNVAAIAYGWSRTGPPEVDGVPIELGRALELLGPREGVTPALTRQLLGGDPILALDELCDIARLLHLSFGARSSADEVAIPTATDQESGWLVNAFDLAADLRLERRVLAYHSELAESFAHQRPEHVHNLRIAPFGPPPRKGSRYRALFEYFDARTEGKFRLSIDELDHGFAGKIRDRHLPETARNQRGWWSNPRPGADGRPQGIGSQKQRAAWLTAGYAAMDVRIDDRGKVASVTFQAVPGRELWHPFRAKLRGEERDKLQTEKELNDVLEEHGVAQLHWFHTILSNASGRSVFDWVTDDVR